MADSFQVTSCTVNKSIIAPTDTVEIKLTVKNVTGSKVVKFGVSFLFTSADLGISNGWVPTLAPESSVSWANNASKTFTYSVCPDSIMSQAMYNSYYNNMIKPRLAELKTLPFRIEMTGVCSDGCGVFEDYTTSDLRYIDQWYRPVITLDAWRYPDDESEALAATMKVELEDGPNASRFTATMRYAQDAKATTSSPVFNMVVERDVLFGVGYSANTSILPGTFTNGSMYSFLLVVTDGYETATAQITVDRAFANMHLSGKTTGGVAFGRFSTATQGSPKLECDYPAYFYGGIEKGGVSVANITSINSNFKLYHSGEYPRVIRMGNVVFLEGCLSPSKTLTMSSTSNQYTMCTIPAGYRPPREMAILCQGSSLCTWLMRLSTAGAVILERYSKGGSYVQPASGNWLPFSAMWIMP